MSTTSRTYRVHLPTAEAIRLAATGTGWARTPEGRCAQAISDWLASLEHRHIRCVTVAKISRDLWPILDQPPLTGQPPTIPGSAGPPLPGRVRHLGSGIIRIDSTALSGLAELSPAEDVRITFPETGPALIIGQARYTVAEDTQAG